MNEYVLVAVIAIVVLFGGTQVPKIARSIGSAKSEFHKGQREGEAANNPPESNGTSTSESTSEPKP